MPSFFTEHRATTAILENARQLRPEQAHWLAFARDIPNMGVIPPKCDSTALKYCSQVRNTSTGKGDVDSTASEHPELILRAARWWGSRAAGVAAPARPLPDEDVLSWIADTSLDEERIRFVIGADRVGATSSGSVRTRAAGTFRCRKTGPGNGTPVRAE